jgi:hypothetical protein
MKKNGLIVIGLMLASFVGLHAKYNKVRSESSFNSMLDKNELVVVMFYHDDKGMRDQLSDFQSAARSEKNAAYIAINLDKADLSSLGDLYHVNKTPLFMLFRNGVVYKEGTVLVGEQSSAAIGQFVRDNFGKYLSRIRKRKRREAEANRPSVSFGIGYGYPYDAYPYYGPYYSPYYGYYGAPYYSRPGFSFGIGF